MAHLNRFSSSWNGACRNSRHAWPSHILTSNTRSRPAAVETSSSNVMLANTATKGTTLSDSLSLVHLSGPSSSLDPQSAWAICGLTCMPSLAWPSRCALGGMQDGRVQGALVCASCSSRGLGSTTVTLKVLVTLDIRFRTRSSGEDDACMLQPKRFNSVDRIMSTFVSVYFNDLALFRVFQEKIVTN